MNCYKNLTVASVVISKRALSSSILVVITKKTLFSFKSCTDCYLLFITIKTTTNYEFKLELDIKSQITMAYGI